MDLSNIISWLLFGAVAGTLANVIDPRQSQGGWIGSIILGILGSFVGGWLGNALFGVGVSGWNISSFIVAVAGSLLLLFVGKMLRRA